MGHSVLSQVSTVHDHLCSTSTHGKILNMSVSHCHSLSTYMESRWAMVVTLSLLILDLCQLVRSPVVSQRNQCRVRHQMWLLLQYAHRRRRQTSNRIVYRAFPRFWKHPITLNSARLTVLPCVVADIMIHCPADY